MGTNDYADCLITNCSEVIRSTSRRWQVDFVLYFMRGAMGSGALCLESLHSVLTWPEAWQLVEFEPYIWGSGTLDPGGTTHTLGMDWSYDGYPIGDAQGSVVPVARLRMNVVGPGRLDFASGAHSAVLRHDCYGSTFVTYPVQVYAEAGMECGHISAHCAYYEGFCEPHFYVEELRLRAPSGGAADSTVRYWAFYWSGLCPVTVDTHAPWCTAWAESVAYEVAELHVTADAAGLATGTYETAIELSAGSTTSRCLPVMFTVDEQPTATASVSWGRVKALYR